MTIRSLFSGISGLQAQTNAIDAIGNNIANVNTVGFRRARITFSDLFSQTLSGAVGATATQGGVNPRQIGLGVQTDSIDTVFTQGNPQQTGRLLDLSIRGSGFFQLTNGEGGSFFTRAGNFGLDELGFVTKPGSGLRLMGQIADANGQISSEIPPQALQIDFNRLADAITTQTATLGGNLSSATQPKAASSLNTLLSLFSDDGIPIGLNAGDTIQISGGTYDTSPPSGVIDLVAGGNQNVVTISPTTNLADLANSLRTTLRNLTGSTQLEVSVDSAGRIRFENGDEVLSDLVITAVDVNGGEKSNVRGLFNDGELDGNIDVAANSFAQTSALRQADATTSTNVFDSQGNSRTVITAFGRDTRNIPAATDSLLSALVDEDDRDPAMTVGSDVVIAAGSDLGGGALGADLAVLTVTATTTLEDLRAALETQVNSQGAADKTVTLLEDGSFRVSSPTDTINVRLHTDPDGAGVGAASTSGALTRMFAGRNMGIDVAGTDGLMVTAGTTAETNTFHQDDTILNSWHYQVVVPHSVDDPPSTTVGRLVFLGNGNFQNYGIDANGNVATNNPVITFDPDGTDPENGGVDSLTIQFDFSGVTQNASTTSAAILSQDGSPVGRLESIDISPDGTITGVFSNGTTRTLAQILVASFANEGGLMRRGENLFVGSANSGEPVLGSPGTLARGDIQSSELELSNVDISEEFVNLILAQRAFQANARVITTGDNVLNELVNLIQ